MPQYIIVGQGLCGTFLSYFLQKENKDILVIDTIDSASASRVASGIINPVTGRRIVKTWLIDELLPFCESAYTTLGNKLNASLIRQCNVLDFFATPQMKEAFEDRMQEEQELLRLSAHTELYNNFFRFNYEVGEINSCYLTDVQSLLNQWRMQLRKKHCLWEEKFELGDLSISGDKVKYKNIIAEKIIFCDGVAGADNPYFNKLPFAFNKGEALLVRIAGLPQDYIYKQGISIVPWKEKNLFWVGSNYTWQYDSIKPTEAFKKRTEEQLNYWLRLPFSVEDHWAAERPANVERRPFVGLHPLYPAVGILNGMGTKGCSLAPYFAHQFAQHLAHHAPIEPLADMKRFARVLSR